MAWLGLKLHMACVLQEVLDLRWEVGQLFQEGMAHTTELLLSTVFLCTGKGEIGMGTNNAVNRSQNTLFTH